MTVVPPPTGRAPRSSGTPSWPVGSWPATAARVAAADLDSGLRPSRRSRPGRCGPLIRVGHAEPSQPPGPEPSRTARDHPDPAASDCRTPLVDHRMTSEHLEIERKYDAARDLPWVDLSSLPGVRSLAGPAEKHLDATYYDTDTLALTGPVSPCAVGPAVPTPAGTSRCRRPPEPAPSSVNHCSGMRHPRRRWWTGYGCTSATTTCTQSLAGEPANGAPTAGGRR